MKTTNAKLLDVVWAFRQGRKFLGRVLTRDKTRVHHFALQPCRGRHHSSDDKGNRAILKRFRNTGETFYAESAFSAMGKHWNDTLIMVGGSRGINAFCTPWKVVFCYFKLKSFSLSWTPFSNDTIIQKKRNMDLQINMLDRQNPIPKHRCSKLRNVRLYKTYTICAIDTKICGKEWKKPLQSTTPKLTNNREQKLTST